MSYHIHRDYEQHKGNQSDIRKKVIVVWICSKLLFSISSISIYYGTQSDIRVKNYCRLNLVQASVFNFKRFDLLRDSIRHPSKKLLSIEFVHNFGIQFRASRYITWLNKTLFVKSYCRLNLVRDSTFNLERLYILRDSIRHQCKKLLSFEFAQSFDIQFRASR